ncbi:hypothetical protein ACU8OP_14460 [Rhizobium leguminosarum]
MRSLRQWIHSPKVIEAFLDGLDQDYRVLAHLLFVELLPLDVILDILPENISKGTGTAESNLRPPVLRFYRYLGRRERRVAIHPDTWSLLTDLANRVAERSKSSDTQCAAKLFSDRNGKPVTSRNLRAVFRATSDNLADGERVTPTSLRRCGIYHWTLAAVAEARREGDPSTLLNVVRGCLKPKFVGDRMINQMISMVMTNQLRTELIA